MERNELITKVTNEFIENSILESFSTLLEDILKNYSLYMKEIMLAFDLLFQKGIEYQKENKKDDIAFVGINFLQNSLLNETFEFEIELYDEKYLGDKNAIVCKYVPSFMVNYYTEQWISYVKYMKGKVIQLKKNEIYTFRLILADIYKNIMKNVFIQFTPFVMRLLSYKNLMKSDNVKILYGDYYGKCVQLN